MSALPAGWLDEAPPSPTVDSAVARWARAALASSPPREGPRSSPCPEAERRAAEVAAVGEWDVEEDSVPVSLRAAEVAVMMMRGEEEQPHG